MKRLLLLATVVACVSSLAIAQPNPGSIGIFSDQLGTDCNVTDGTVGIMQVFIVHVITNGTTGSVFMMETDPSITLQYVGETSPFQTIIGDTQNGISVAYGSCLTGPFLVATINYFATGTSAACGLMSIIPWPAAPTGLVEIVDCSYNKHTIPRGGQARVNPDGTCTCNVATHESSWGAIKSLYK